MSLSPDLVPFTTPQRLPGTYLQTPAVNRDSFISAGLSQPRTNAISTQSQAGISAVSAQPQNASQKQNQGLAQQLQQPALHRGRSSEALSHINRAWRTVQDTLTQETQYPELDSYIGQGVSAEYDISTQQAWAPFQKVKMYPIPDQIFQQYNRAQVSTMMGLFADLNHAWVSIDSALYLWDYTHPSPDLIGFEEQSNSITAVRLVYPRTGVFVATISRLLVVATTAEVILVGLASEPSPTGGSSVRLYSTGMSIPLKGMDVSVIEGSPTAGRVFFCGNGDNDVYEMTYQQEEKWFHNRCAKYNHTTRGLATIAPIFAFGQRPLQEHVTSMAVDDTRRLLYTLSSRSTIRTFHMTSTGGLDLVIVKTIGQTLNNIGHITSQSELISPDMRIVSISPISGREGSRLHLMATSSTGCRVFMSATSSYGWSVTSSSNAPSSMQVQHIRFPPSDSNRQFQQQYGNDAKINTSSRALNPTREAYRYPPGYFFCFVTKDSQTGADSLFVSSPDAGRIAKPREASGASRYIENGLWLDLGSRAEDVGLTTPPFSAAASPPGFGNELAVQYDHTASEIAILTNTGIHTIRRRRLVDVFAAAIRSGGADEGFQGEVRRFITLYGRSETAATALAVACGQGLDITSDARVARITDPEVLENARKAYIEFGGKPSLNDNAINDQVVPDLDSVRPSPRHEGLALYIARIIRSIWRTPIIRETLSPTGGLSIFPIISLVKLREIQGALTKLQDFLDANKSFIDGLSGPEALGRVSTKQAEISMQAEHRALYSLVLLITNIIEGISFVLVLFDERIEEIILSLSNEIRKRVRELTYDGLISTDNGKDLAKELVRAIVNRNIAQGSNVETVAEALRRRCGSFCSADDVIIFKAQEQLKKAAEAGSNSDVGRNLLNDSLRLFKQVAAALSMEQLQSTIQRFVAMQFYAGAIQLALNVAQESDRGNRALTWIQDGRPDKDPRAAAFQSRQRSYNLIHQVITSMEQASIQTLDTVDGHFTLAAKRKGEADDIIHTSNDEVFQTDLYDWYLAEGRVDRLLAIQSPYIVTYLQRKSSDDIFHADLLWRYYAQAGHFNDAATVQLALAKSAFTLKLQARIAYLSSAKGNASSLTTGVSRSTRQALLREISDLLDIASIQDELILRLKGDARIDAERKREAVGQLDGPIWSINDMYNTYADQAGYFDLCILMYQAADHRNPADIRTTWQNLLEQTHRETLERGQPEPYEAVAEIVRHMASSLKLSESTFPVLDLIPMLKTYQFDHQRDVGPATWVIDLFVELEIPFEAILSPLQAMLRYNERPFHGANRRYIANDMVYVIQRWFQESSQRSGIVFGSEANAAEVSQILLMLTQIGLDEERVEQCQVLRTRIEHILR